MSIPKISSKLYSTISYFLPRLMFLRSKYGANTSWGDIVLALNNFPENYLDLSSSRFWDIWQERWQLVAENYITESESSLTDAGRSELVLSACSAYHWSEFMYFSNQRIKKKIRDKIKLYFWSSLYIFPYKIYNGQFNWIERIIPYHVITPSKDKSEQNEFPCVILSNGLDSVTELEIFSFSESFLNRGLAVVLFDGPGQGVNIGESPIEYEFEFFLEKLLNEINKLRYINSEKLCFFGVSFGGYLALRTAYNMDNIFKCVINLSGGPYLSPYDTMPRRLKQDFSYAFMEKELYMQAKFDQMKLKTNIPPNTKVLSIHGELDDIFPIDGLKELESSSNNIHKLITFKNEAHVCLNQINSYTAIMSDWAAKILK